MSVRVLFNNRYININYWVVSRIYVLFHLQEISVIIYQYRTDISYINYVFTRTKSIINNNIRVCVLTDCNSTTFLLSFHSNYRNVGHPTYTYPLLLHCLLSVYPPENEFHRESGRIGLSDVGDDDDAAVIIRTRVCHSPSLIVKERTASRR